jgi:hypothetical protein
MAMRPLGFACAVLAGCASGPVVPEVRFANAPVAVAVNDRLDVKRAPHSRLFLPDTYVWDGTIGRPLSRALELPRDRRALGVNALDEVPDSTWFTNRIGVRELTPDEIRNGPLTDDLERHKPWTIHSTKIGGTAPGLIIKDATGVKYLLKFDPTDEPPELETGNHVIVNRLLWACGYHVAEDRIVYLRSEDLVLARDATVKDLTAGDQRRLDRAELERDLARVRHEPDGRIRALASRWIDGVTLGGHPAEGVRDDDPNDRIPHELRRDLRGAYPIYAWVDSVDVTEGQYVDAWVADPGEPARHYVKHYLIDFGKSLGAMGDIAVDWWRSVYYRVDLSGMLRNLFTFGLNDRPWQDRHAPRLKGVASLFEARTFDPGSWHPDSPGYLPFLTADRFDRFWGAGLVARFSRAQIRAAVEAGRFSDPRAADYLTDTLVARQRATAAYWFARVNPLDRFTLEAAAGRDELCFDDLAVVSRIAPAEATRYTVTSYDIDGRELDAHTIPAASDGRACARIRLTADDRRDGYTIVRLATTRPGFTGDTFVHVARDPSSGAPRLIGVWRR